MSTVDVFSDVKSAYFFSYRCSCTVFDKHAFSGLSIQASSCTVYIGLFITVLWLGWLMVVEGIENSSE